MGKFIDIEKLNALCMIKDDKDLTITHANSPFYELIGYQKEELMFKFANRLSVLLGANISMLIHKELINEKMNVKCECQIKNNHGKDIWVFLDLNRVDNEYITLSMFDITMYKSIEDDYIHFQEKSKNIFSLTSLGVYEYDFSTLTLMHIYSDFHIDNSVCLNQRCPESYLENKLIDSVEFNILKNSFNNIKAGQERDFCEFKVLGINDEMIHVRSALMKVEIQNKKRIIHVITDITAQIEATQKYLNEMLYYRAMLSDQVAYGHLDVTLNKVLKVGGIWSVYNDAIHKMSFMDLFIEMNNKIVHSEDREHYLEVMSIDNMLNSFNNGMLHLGCEFRRIIEQNKMTWMSLTIHLFKDPLTSHVMALLYIKNVNDIHLLAEQHRNIYYRDKLTNFYTKMSVEELITEYIHELPRASLSTLLLIEVTNYEDIYNTYEKTKADKDIVNLSRCLDTIFRKSDLYGRLKENLFIVLLKNYECDDNLVVRFNQLFANLRKDKNHVEINIGVALIERGVSYERCFKHANMALFKAKEIGVNHYIFYHEQLSYLLDKDQYHFKEKSQISRYDILRIEDERIEKFNNLVGEEGDIAYLIDPNTYELILGNIAFYNRFGGTPSQFKHKKCYEIIHKRNTPCPFCRKSNWSHGKYYLYRNYNDILEQEFLIKNKLVSFEGEQMLLAIAVDLSNDKVVTELMSTKENEKEIMLNGIHLIQTSTHLQEVVSNALSSIGDYFRAKNIRLWIYDKENFQFKLYSYWVNAAVKSDHYKLDDVEQMWVDQWLNQREWTNQFKVDTQEAMFGHSLNMYKLMKKHSITNTRWVELGNENELIGIFEINNINANIQNQSFMESFSGYILNEWKNRVLFEKTLHQNYHDALTKTLNRLSYDIYISHYQSDEVDSIAAICINMNDLSQINELSGVSIGDYYLVKLSDQIQHVFGKENTYRVNGDEFLVILKNQDIIHIEQLVSTFKTRIEEFDQFSVSIGYAWDNIEKDIEELIHTSIAVMQNNKHQYKRQKESIRVDNYQQEQHRLITSIEKGCYEVFLQPKYDTLNGEFYGAEALIRYRDPELGIIPPIKYLPALEKNKLIRYIDFFVFEEVCRLIQKWQAEGFKIPIISLNFSRMTLMEENLVEHIESIIEKYNVNKQWIEIEVTESIEEIGKAVLYQSIKKLHHAGYRIALDDFGINYTNLSILLDVEFEVLKMDRSLIHSLVLDVKNRVVLRHVILMCEELGIQVIAEGVENSAQCDILNELGCYYIQGYYFSKPLDVGMYEQNYIKK